MDKQKFEKHLSRKLFKRRLYLVIAFSFFLALGIISTRLYVNSKEVEILDYIFQKIEIVTYNYNYVYGIVIGWVGGFFSFLVLTLDFIFLKFSSVNVEESLITLYRGFFRISLYIDGIQQDSYVFGRNYLKGTLKNGTKVTASRGWFFSYHLTFSSDHQSLDI